ncbi:T9SS type A sorting domain-containing protein [bacterium SCSIO 12643]|nr:T9SS type A sorting domain-containing protein [bacterium SCSIO 12643]
MRRLLLVGIILLLVHRSYGQNWPDIQHSDHADVRGLFADTLTGDLYVLQGGGANALVIRHPDGSYTTHQNIGPKPVFAGIRYKGELFLGGTGGLVKYDSTLHDFQWFGNINGQILDMLVKDDKLYVFGNFSKADTVNCESMAMWDGVKWSRVDNYPASIPEFDLLTIACATFYKGELYVGGILFDQINGGNVSVVRGNGSTFKLVTDSLRGPFDAVNTMLMHNDTLYMGGLFYEVYGAPGNCILAWDGNHFHQLGQGVTNLDLAQVMDLEIWENQLVMSGNFNSVDNISASRIAIWDGHKWCGFGGDFQSGVGALTILRDTLFVGGGFNDIDGNPPHNLTKWNGGSYRDTCSWPVGISENEVPEFRSVQIYPNPVMDLLQVDLSGIKQNTDLLISIFSIDGKLIQTFYPQNIGTTYQINVEDFAKGSYLLKVVSGKNVQVLKFEKL